jgi:hypothetical protein
MNNLLYSITQIILFALFLSNRQVRENNGGFYNCMSQCVTLIILSSALKDSTTTSSRVVIYLWALVLLLNAILFLRGKVSRE